MLAALNHPHIAAIYGLEQSDNRQALVLELVEGVTLAERIAEGPLPLVESLTIARQIADGLDAAHQKGIVHRDLKPANIKVTPAGMVKVLDFGLAKMAADDVPLAHLSGVTTGDGDTRVGMILGTAAYMSPEQARGQAVDARTDIWAFGAVLFEMLTGRRAFAADTASDSIARILEREPDWNALPRSTPKACQHLLRQCLRKDPRDRTQTIADARAVLDDLLRPAIISRWAWMASATAAALAVAVGLWLWGRSGPAAVAGRSDWVQLTNLDSATQPALSPDGRMVAFIRGDTFVSPGQVYVKQLPDGEPIPLTHDDLPKMGPAFAPDGTRIAYTVADASSWDTWQVSVLRGEPRRWLRNASGLTWIGKSDLLFSETKQGVHMAIVRAPDNRAESRDLYMPPHQSGMAHKSNMSPDGKWVLVIEMDEKNVWLPCRVVPIDGGPSQPVGPSGAKCTNAAWTPDGYWMYFSADAGDGFHIWRQRFPAGRPEQVTSGPTEEEGLSVAPDGQSIITSVGLAQRSVLLHDSSGERQISLEGYAYWPLLSADGRRVCFRATHATGIGQTPSELWMSDLGSGQIRRLLPGQLVTGYDLSRDDRVVASVQEGDGKTRLWLAWLDDREPPRPIPHAVGDNPRFNIDGNILFRVLEGTTAFLCRIRENGDGLEKITEARGTVFGGVSPDGKWLTMIAGQNNSVTSAYSTRDGTEIRIFLSSLVSRLRWGTDGQHAYLSVQYAQASAFAAGRTYVLPLAKHSVLPNIPPGGFRTEAEIAAVPGVEIIPYGDVAPGPSPSVYAFSRVTTTRNLYRIPLR